MTQHSCSCPPPNDTDINLGGIPMIVTTWSEPDIDCEAHGIPAYVRFFGHRPPGY